ncbi:MAG: leucine-rich repeat protein [Clostridia bacterium]|nr:leucine-rich repeat protein [Clostridia bacterium]
MKGTKRWISIFVSAAVCLLSVSAFSLPVAAEDTAQSGVVMTYDEERCELRFSGEGVVEATPELRAYKKLVKSVVFEKGITEIGDKAFYMFRTLEHIKMTAVKKVDRSAFNNCTELKTIDLGNALEYIGDYAFVGCKNAEGFRLPNTVKYIGMYAMSGIFKDFAPLPEGLEIIGPAAFAASAIGRDTGVLVIPESVKYMGVQCFRGTFISTLIIKSPYVDPMTSAAGMDNGEGPGLFGYYANCLEQVIVLDPDFPIGHIKGAGAADPFESAETRTTLYCPAGSSVEEYAQKWGMKTAALETIWKDGQLNLSQQTVSDVEIRMAAGGDSGDISGDGVVNMEDCMLLYRGVSGEAALDPVQASAGDLDHNGAVNMIDALMLYRTVSG